MSDQRSNFAMGMNMPDEIYAKAIPIFIRQDRSDNFVTNLREADYSQEQTYYIVEEDNLVQEKRKGRFANIYPFGMTDTGFSTDDVSYKRAKLIHYLYCTADYDAYLFKGKDFLETMPLAIIWSEAETEWQKLSVALKWSNLYSAYCLPCKIASIRAMRGLSPGDTSRDLDALSNEEVELMAIVEHNRWNVEKLLMGYRKANLSEDKYEHTEYADLLCMNKELFIHHDIRPYASLDAVRQLDKEFSKYIPWIIKMTVR